MEGTTNLVVYNNGEIIHNTHEGVRFVSQNPFSFVVPCTMTLMELQNGLCKSMENSTLMRVSIILYRNPIVVFGGLIQFDPMPITDEASMQNMFQIHRQTQMRHPQTEVYVEFETVEAVADQNDIDIHDDRDAVYEGMNSDSEEDFEATYEAGDEDEDGDLGVEAAAENVVVRPSSNQPMDVPPFMRVADVEDGEFRIGMEYSSRKSVVAAIRSFTISKGVEYEVYESEPQTFYAKCKMYGRRCDWLIRASLIRKKGCWEIRRYNGRHTCTIGTISQDHSKLDSDTIAEAIRPLVEIDPSIKVKSIIAEVQSKFNYTISYRKAWLAKQKSIANVFSGWEDSYQALPWWLSIMVQKMPGSIVQIETRPLYNGNEEAQDVKILHRTLLVAVAQDGNQNIVPIAFALVEGETTDAWHFFFKNLRMYVVRKDGVGMISDRHESIRVAVNRSDGYSRTVEEYNINYKRLEERGKAYARWCDAIGLKHWVLAFDEGHRWSDMITNLVECINSVLKGAQRCNAGQVEYPLMPAEEVVHIQTVALLGPQGVTRHTRTTTTEQRCHTPQDGAATRLGGSICHTRWYTD
ncbi:uncharacterized protein [Arachis hypogaea]|uniref:uncharacterized protein n=1 Tax=Arachis hypogaea TaxID=3818 RepID=UPI000DEC64A3|nr:uncharacterized protein LOC112712802 [Arachis hypogaea]